jgi:hypothetical protein
MENKNIVQQVLATGIHPATEEDIQKLENLSLENQQTAEAEELNQENEQIPETGIGTPTDEPTGSKVLVPITVPIDQIEYDEPKYEVEKNDLISRMETCVSLPWNKICNPLLCSKLPEPTNGKLWKVRDGYKRLMVAKKKKLTHVVISVLEGTEDEIQEQLHSKEFLRYRKSTYEEMKKLEAWEIAFRKSYDVYTAGGNQAEKKKQKLTKGLPPIADVIQAVTGKQKTTFYDNLAAFKSLTPEIKKVLDNNPHCRIASKQQDILALSDRTPEEQKMEAPFIAKATNEQVAYFRAFQDNANKQGGSLPDVNNLYSIYHEPFWENAKRIELGSIDLIVTDPNWMMMPNDLTGTYYEANGLKIAPQLTPEIWEQCCQLAVKRLAKTGSFLVEVGEEGRFSIETITRKYFPYRGRIAYIHVSGRGTLYRRAGVASHTRDVLVFNHPDNPPKFTDTTLFLSDICPSTAYLPRLNPTLEEVIHGLKLDIQELTQRLAELEAGNDDPYLDDTVYSLLASIELNKRWHPWAGDINGWRDIVRRFPRGNGRAWEPFVGSGAIVAALVTCTYPQRDPVTKKWKDKLIPWQVIGCDAMKRWANIAKYRVSEALKETEQPKPKPKPKHK